jgi:hypothetical protein
MEEGRLSKNALQWSPEEEEEEEDHDLQVSGKHASAHFRGRDYHEN